MAFIPVVLENVYLPNSNNRFGQRSNRFGNGSYRSENIPSHLMDNLTEDIVNSIALAQALFGPEYIRNQAERSTIQQQSRSSVIVEKDKYQANFDVQHFRPEEITVKVTGDRTVTIEAKHEEKQDEHGQIFRHFVRTYVLPECCDMRRLESRLSSDGVLSITAPTVIQPGIQHRTIPITQTGKPVRSVEEKKSEHVIKED